MNEEIKKRFLESGFLQNKDGEMSEYKEKISDRIFGKLPEWEEKFNKDAAMFNYEEVKEMFRSFDCYSFKTLRNQTDVLDQYTQYYKRNIDSRCENVYHYIDLSFLKECIDAEHTKNKYISYKQFQEILASTLNATERAVCLLLWDGVRGTGFSDILYLERDRIDFKEKIIYGAERIYYVSEQTCKELDAALREQYLINYKDKKVRRVEGLGRLYKESVNAKAAAKENRRYRWMSRMLASLKEEFELPLLTARQIIESGELHCIKELMKQTGMPFKELMLSPLCETIIRRYEGKYDRQIRKSVIDRFVDYV